MLFFVKVEVDVSKLEELGAKLQTGSLDTGSILSTHCLKRQPSVGVNIWEAKDRDDFERKFAPHRQYYDRVIDIEEVISPDESYRILTRG